jgi:hypothetical protein
VNHADLVTHVTAAGGRSPDSAHERIDQRRRLACLAGRMEDSSGSRQSPLLARQADKGANHNTGVDVCGYTP